MNHPRLSMGCVLATAVLTALGGQVVAAQASGNAQDQTTQPPERRIPQQKPATTGAVQGILFDEDGRPLPGVMVRLESAGHVAVAETTSNGDGIFRLREAPPGVYDLLLSPASGSVTFRRSEIRVGAGVVLSIEIHLTGFRPPQPAAPLPQNPAAENPAEGQPGGVLPRPGAQIPAAVEVELPAEDVVFQPRPDRWNTEMPDYHRYPDMEAPLILGHWYDPFNRNRLKGDKPLFGKTFFSFTGESITALDGRRLPVTSGLSTAEPGEYGFFGKGGQFFMAQTFRTTFDLFHGDTAAFRPVDWRIRITPAANLNYLAARENGIVSPDVREGTTRFDTHVSLQEAFGEVKLADVGPSYDFINLRVGIQQFVSDFRGFIFADEQPGARLFGNLRSNRIQWNLAGFDLLEKNTNSGLNTFSRRGREVAIANVYFQDFFAKGYTAQLSYHFVRDDGRMHYDDNGFLVRPAPLGKIEAHRLDTDYAGLTGDGHIGR
ncbi:MAG: carboxypeptidase-like regulatory domain-containing protein, partial [Terracidiphilus sp.]